MTETPFRHVVVDGEYAVPPLDWLPPAGDPVWEARYENAAELHKRTTRRLDALPPAVQAVFAGLRGQDLSGWLGYPVCDDPTLHGGGLHVTEAGGRLAVHLDYDRHPRIPLLRRAVNLIAFLNPEWRPEWGGALVLCDPDGRAVKRVPPAPGRVVAFECSDLSYHAVEPISADAPPRVTAAVYHLAVAGPANTRRRALFLPDRSAA